MLNSALKTLVFARDNQLPEVTDAQFLGFIDRAIVNVRAELKTFEPDAFEEFLESQSVTSSGYSFPADYARDEDPLFFVDGQKETPIPSDNWYERAGKWYLPSYSTVNISYSKDIARQTSLAGTLPLSTRKAEEILISEIMALIYASNDENEATASYNNSLAQSNKVQ